MKGLTVDRLEKSYGEGDNLVRVLDGVTFKMDRGQMVAVTGPSGSGKSTLLHLIGALDRPTAGTIALDGVDAQKLDDAALAQFRNRQVGFIFQDHHLLPQYNVLENVLIPTLAAGGGDDTDTDRARTLLDRVGLAHRLTHRPAELSGGERQRVAVARALIQSPTLLLCDEPTGSLDRQTAVSVADLLFELHGQENTILIVVTHSDELAGRFPRKLQLSDGKCLEL
ncbi:MAG: ABC transporter ATP-binding protein [Acidobacteriota bacterium]|nr:ABC transporter ATP-binding protein [Acidobacteriota bacterium]